MQKNPAETTNNIIPFAPEMMPTLNQCGPCDGCRVAEILDVALRTIEDMQPGAYELFRLRLERARCS